MNMRTIVTLILLALAGRAEAVSSYLGTAIQDVSGSSVAISAPLPSGSNNIGDVDVLTLPSIPAGTNNIGDVDVLTLPSIPAGTNNIGDVDVLTLPSIPAGGNSIGSVGLNAGTNNIGTVSGSSVTSIITDAGGEQATVTGGRLDVNATITSADVSVSTVGIRGASGSQITDTTVGSGNALDVLNAGRPSLDGKTLVYKSSDNFVVGGALTLTGLANQVDLQALGNDCTFNIAGGEDINVAKNTAESFTFDYTASNLTVNLTAKSGGATCKARMVGAN